MTDPRVQRVEHLLDLGRYQQALELVDVLLAEHPDGDVPGGGSGLHGLAARGLLGLERPHPALVAARREVASHPDDPWGHVLCSLALQETGDRDGAVHAALAAVARGPHWWATHVRYALAASLYPTLLRDAGAAARRAVALAPHEAETHFAVGLVEAALGRTAIARRAYTEVLRLEPDHAAALNNVTLLDRRFRLVPAARLLNESLRSEPGNRLVADNVVRLGLRFTQRLLWAGLVGLMTTVLVVGGDPVDPGAGELHWVGVLTGSLTLLGMAVATIVVGRALPRGVRLLLRGAALTHGLLLPYVVAVAAVVVGIVLAAYVPGGVRAAADLARVAIFFTLGAAIARGIQARSERRG